MDKKDETIKRLENEIADLENDNQNTEYISNEFERERDKALAALEEIAAIVKKFV